MRNAATQEQQPQQPHHSQQKEDKLPEQLFPTFKTPTPPSSSVVLVTEMSTQLKTAETATMIKLGGSSSASSSSSLPSGPPKLSSFRSSLTGASLASFTMATESLLPLASLPLLPAPMQPLLSRGAGRSSAHLGLVAMDPESSVLGKDVLNKLKLAYIKGGSCTPSTTAASSSRSASSSSVASVPTPPTAHGQRKRRSSRLTASALKEQEEAETSKKQKVLPLVPQQSLLTLEKQLSRGADADGEKKNASPVDMELAAFALARHLVDWASSFDLDAADSDDEEEEVPEQITTSVPAALPMQQAPHILPAEWLSVAPQFFDLSATRGESGRALDGQGDFQSFHETPIHDNDIANEFASTASTPSFEPHMEHEDSQASASGATAIVEDDQQQQQQLLGGHEDLCMHQQQLQEEEEQAHAAMDSTRLSIQLSPLLSPYAAPLMHMPLHLLSPLASPKVSPSLLAHLASPHERAAMLGGAFSLDDLPPVALQPSADSPLLAHTTTSAGAHVSLIQHNGTSTHAPHMQMAW